MGGGRFVAGRAAVVAVAVLAAGGWPAAVPPAVAAPATGRASLAGGRATGRGVFLTYSDRDTVVDGGTVAAPDTGAPTADAAIDLTGLGSALAALGYSPYSDAAGVVNAFGGTDLPVSSVAARSRAKVEGRPPQDSDVTVSGGLGRARARLVDGPTAEARTSVGEAPTSQPAAAALTVRIGEVRATVTTVEGTADAKVVVVLRSIRIGDALHIDAVTLAADALADGTAGAARSTVLVEGVTLGGTAVRLTPQGVQPAGPAPPDTAALARAGIEVVAAGQTASHPGGRQADAVATGPRLRLRSADGRVLTVVLGQAVASSTWVPARD